MFPICLGRLIVSLVNINAVSDIRERQVTYNFPDHTRPYCKLMHSSPVPIRRYCLYPAAMSCSAQASPTRMSQSILLGPAHFEELPGASGWPALEVGLVRWVRAFSGCPNGQRRLVLAVLGQVERAAQGPEGGQMMCIPSWLRWFAISTLDRCGSSQMSGSPSGRADELGPVKKRPACLGGLKRRCFFVLGIRLREEQKLQNYDRVLGRDKASRRLLVAVQPNPQEQYCNEKERRDELNGGSRGHAAR